MGVARWKIAAILTSAALHGVLLAILFRSWGRDGADFRWSGGRGGIVVVGVISVEDPGTRPPRPPSAVTAPAEVEASAAESPRHPLDVPHDAPHPAPVASNARHEMPRKPDDTRATPPPATRTAPTARLGTGNSNTPTGGTGAGLDPDGTFSETPPNILSGIRKKIARKQFYPEAARVRSLKGTVKVAFRILPSGELGEVSVLSSSGSAILDEAAVRTVRRAAPLPYIPDTIALSLEYRLE